MQLEKAIKSRRSVRTFLDKEISEESLKKIIEYATHAPSACNTQPWKYYIVRKQEIKDKLSQTHQYTSFINKAPVNIVACLDKSKTLFEPSDLVSLSLSIQNLLLGITEEKMGACYVYVKDSKEEENVKHVSEILGLPENIIPIGIIALGYTDEKPKEKAVHGYDEIVTEIS